MKITALDIHQKEFGHAMRGYREEEVDDFLDAVAAEVDHLAKETEVLAGRLHEAESKIGALDSERNAINNALLIAQRSADEILEQADIEQKKIVDDAQERAESLIHEALAQKRELLGEIKRLKGEEERFRRSYLKLLDDSHANIQEIRLSDSLMAALDEKEKSYASVVAKGLKTSDAPLAPEPEEDEPAPFIIPEPAVPTIEVEETEVEELESTQSFAKVPAAESADKPPVFEITPEPAPVFESRNSAAPEPAPEPAPVFNPEPKPAPKPVIPSSKPSNVEGFLIGEVGDDKPVDTKLEEPREFEIPGGDRWGDRDDDLDIEEID